MMATVFKSIGDHHTEFFCWHPFYPGAAFSLSPKHWQLFLRHVMEDEVIGSIDGRALREMIVDFEVNRKDPEDWCCRLYRVQIGASEIQAIEHPDRRRIRLVTGDVLDRTDPEVQCRITDGGYGPILTRPFFRAAAAELPSLFADPSAAWK